MSSLLHLLYVYEEMRNVFALEFKLDLTII